ncbi:hypothetical protein CEXT_502191 [Caerostris extrusa]|uniref:Uncharacterized protein n=1 Tax=Caerostris extrusa TaxID=172846 RepID=A0AAV4U8W4_CAEEX|nr:hypothetical protein CEXT_502191 [Caerostris extrusa]
MCHPKGRHKAPVEKLHLIPPAPNPKANRERGLIMSPERSKRTFVIGSKHQDTRSTVDNSFDVVSPERPCLRTPAPVVDTRNSTATVTRYVCTEERNSTRESMDIV